MVVPSLLLRASQVASPKERGRQRKSVRDVRDVRGRMGGCLHVWVSGVWCLEVSMSGMVPVPLQHAWKRIASPGVVGLQYPAARARAEAEGFHSLG